MGGLIIIIIILWSGWVVWVADGGLVVLVAVKYVPIAVELCTQWPIIICTRVSSVQTTIKNGLKARRFLRLRPTHRHPLSGLKT